MTEYNPAIQKLTMPKKFAKLPVDERGFPVPKFVGWVDGKPDFRAANPDFLHLAISAGICWLCGEPLGTNKAFVIGPMCAINRINSEPPSHLECARFAVQACPFLTQPKRSRNEYDLPLNAIAPAGIAIKRNPGVSLIWVTRKYKVCRVANGLLFELGDPIALEWWTRGRYATREEIMSSINSGLPLLRAMAEKQGTEAERELDRQIARGMMLVPT